MSPSPDDSSHQITIYGGWNLLDRRAFQDVYVLTVPSFRWIKVSDSVANPEARLPSNIGHKSMECHLRGDRQMLVLGGAMYLGDTQASGQTCNTSYPAIRLLDTTTFMWLSQYSSASEPYSVPQTVYEVIGGSASGGATMKEPSGGFNSTSLTQIFSERVARYPPFSISSSTTPTRPASDTLMTSSNPPANAVSRPLIGAAVGGAVGGLLLFAASVGVIIYLRKRRQRLPLRPTVWEQPPTEIQATLQIYEISGDSSAVHELGGDFYGVEACSKPVVHSRAMVPKSKYAEA